MYSTYRLHLVDGSHDRQIHRRLECQYLLWLVGHVHRQLADAPCCTLIAWSCPQDIFLARDSLRLDSRHNAPSTWVVALHCRQKALSRYDSAEGCCDPGSKGLRWRTSPHGIRAQNQRHKSKQSYRSLVPALTDAQIPSRRQIRGSDGISRSCSVRSNTSLARRSTSDLRSRCLTTERAAIPSIARAQDIHHHLRWHP